MSRSLKKILQPSKEDKHNVPDLRPVDLVLQEYIGATCKIKTFDHFELATGVLNKVTKEPKLALEIGAQAGSRLLLQPLGLPVKILLLMKDQTYKIAGKVYISNENICTLTDITSTAGMEQRDYFRVNVNAPGLVKISNNKEEKAVQPEQEAQQWGIKLVNISLSGVKFSCAASFCEAEHVDLFNVRLSKHFPPFAFTGTVVDKHRGETDEQSIYRCKIDYQSQAFSDRLCKAIFEVERENRWRDKILREQERG